jgi:hypothetical protein
MDSGTRIDALPRWCGLRDSNGVDELPEWQDWTHRETTPDQERIEGMLEAECLAGRVLLHVGIGNSSLARRLHGSAEAIDGITLQENELRHAVNLGLSGYRVRKETKYAANLAIRLGRQYDFIVDNNPTAFCCCRWHLSTMLANYSEMLKPLGVILSDTVGLAWATQPNDARWKLTEREWWTLGKEFGLRSVQYTDFVVGLQRPKQRRSALDTAGRIAAAAGRFAKYGDRWPRSER